MKGPEDKTNQNPCSEECNFRLKEDEELEALLDSFYHQGEGTEWHEEEDEGFDEEEEVLDTKDPKKWMLAEEQAAYGLHAYPDLETLEGYDCPCESEALKPWEKEGYRGPRLREIPEEGDAYDENEDFGDDDGGRYEYRKERWGKESNYDDSGKYVVGKDRSADGEQAGALQNEERYIQSVDEFERFVEGNEAKFEYRQGYIYGMAGGSPDHAAIIANLMGEVRGRLRQKGRRCRAFSSDLMVHVEEDDCIFLPDVSVVCGKPELSPTAPKAIVNPVFLAEVLSPGTEDYDCTAKFESYKLLPTFKEYLLVSQETHHVDRYLKNPHGEWKRTRYMSIDQEVKLQSLGISIPMDLIYEDVEDRTDYYVLPNR